ncbi:Aldehyde/histidinol dehydrogenase [Phlebopus sp. FC_14]|nr:Aldehyde/histidinol dehydrogenase [Phlebopus sp. FC_14]
MTDSLQYHSIDSISKTHEDLTSTFRQGTTLPLAFRRQQLLQLARLVQDNQEAIVKSLEQDLGRHALEAYLPEIGPIVAGAVAAAECLPIWTAPEKPQITEVWRQNWNTTIHKAPKGAVVMISPWNFPWIITFSPLIGAIAAGCTVAIKPSEQSPACAALMAKLVPQYLDQRAFRVVLGGVEETQHLLKLKWGHIFYTGSNRVGRLVAQAAGQNLTPLTLELGGQCPVYVDGKTTDIELAAKRILWGKQQNAGQLCVAPNHVFVEEEYKDALLDAFIKVSKAFYPNGALDDNSSFGRILNDTHLKRLEGLLKDTKGTIEGGKVKGSRLEPTFVNGVTLDDPVMKEEIFGPILPIITVKDADEAIENILSKSTPLVLYVFSNDDEVKNKFVQRTQSGSLIFNETFGQLAVYEIPFGGQGDSGYGAYLGKHSFDTFTHFRGSIDVPLDAATDQAMAGKYPPYSDFALGFFKSIADIPIPSA